MLALAAVLRFWLIDDIYKEDEYGSHILVSLEKARRFNLWMVQTLAPYIGDRVLEIGAGIGTLTSQFIPREFYLASDINPSYLLTCEDIPVENHIFACGISTLEFRVILRGWRRSLIPC